MTLVRRFERHDFKVADLAKPETTPEGYWKLDGKVARTGIQIYRDSQGNVIRELRLEGDVKASLPTFALSPLTNSHPPGLVSPENAKQYVSGAVGEATYADGWVKAPITIWTKDAIDSVRDGRAQLSVGYTCELHHEPGEWQGQRYDAVQKNIVVNHVALVDVARAGPEARLRLDAGDAATADFFDSTESRVESHITTRTKAQETPMAFKITVDGYELEVADANAKAAIERAIEAARADGLAKAKAEKDRADAAELARAASDKALVEAKAKLDTLEASNKVDVKCDECDGSGKVFGAKCDGCDGKGEMKADAALDLPRRKASRARTATRAVADGAAARAKLLALVAPHISANEVLDGKTDVEIKRLTLDKLGIKFEDKSDAYAIARFDAEMDKIKSSTPSELERARATVIEGPKKDGEITPPAPKFDGPDEGRAFMQHRNKQTFVKRS